MAGHRLDRIVPSVFNYPSPSKSFLVTQLGVHGIEENPANFHCLEIALEHLGETPANEIWIARAAQ